jgi:hypothetical protein
MSTVNQPNMVTGQIFIVTNGTENVRLGSIPVQFIPRSVFTRVAGELKNRAAERVTELREKLNEYGHCVAEEERLLPTLKASEVRRVKYDQVESKWDSIEVRLNAVETDVDAAARPYSLLDELYKRIQGVRDGEAISDADGNFFFNRRSSDPLVIVARTSRRLVSGEEVYRWFVDPVSLVPTQGKLVISNSSLSDTPSDANAVKQFMGLISEFSEIRAEARRELSERPTHPPRPHWAPPGTFYLLEYASVQTSAGLVGYPPGTRVKRLQDDGHMVAVTDRNRTFNIKWEELTDNLDIASSLGARDEDVQRRLELHRRQEVGEVKD